MLRKRAEAELSYTRWEGLAGRGCQVWNEKFEKKTESEAIEVKERQKYTAQPCRGEGGIKLGRKEKRKFKDGGGCWKAISVRS